MQHILVHRSVELYTRQKTQLHSPGITQKQMWRNCKRNEKSHRNEQFAWVWRWLNCGSLDFMPPHQQGPLDALGPFKDSTLPLQCKGACWLPQLPPSHFVKRVLKPLNAKTAYNGPTSAPPMIQLWGERNIGEEGDEARRGRRWVDSQTSILPLERRVVAIGVGCMLITFAIFLQVECKIVWQRPSRWTVLACGHPKRNALWKRHSSTQSHCVLMAMHGYMSDGNPLCHSVALSLTLSPRVQLVHCLVLIFKLSLTVCAHPLTVPPYLGLGGYLHTFRPTHTFLSWNFREIQSPTASDSYWQQMFSKAFVIIDLFSELYRNIFYHGSPTIFVERDRGGHSIKWNKIQ